MLKTKNTEIGISIPKYYSRGENSIRSGISIPSWPIENYKEAQITCSCSPETEEKHFQILPNRAINTACGFPFKN